MPPSVTLVLESDHPGQGTAFAFAEAAAVLVGRDESCPVRLLDARPSPQVSRKHCQLILEPPSALVRDLDSNNGTSVNDKLLGSRANPSPVLGRLFDGDRLGVADYRLRVRTTPALCSVCLLPAADDAPRTAEGRPVCAACLASEAPDTCPPAPSGEHLGAVQRLLNHAHTGLPGLLPLRDYYVERALGRGGMGAVYLARHLPTGRHVALKVILPQFADRPDVRARFRREIDNTRALRHPRVVALLDDGCDEDVFYFTMEHCEGGSVEQLIRRRGPMPPAEAVRLTLQILEALHYAHHAPIPHVELRDGRVVSANGLVHRDLKPANLLLSSPVVPDVKVGDFGLAKAFELAGLSGHTRSGDVLGTVPFSSRKQLSNARDCGPEVDVWAAAACLYFMLTGRPVREHAPGQSAVRDLFPAAIAPVRQHRPDVPGALAEAIDRALVEEPAFGYATAAGLREALLAGG